MFQQLALEAPNRAVEKRCHGIATFLCKEKESMCSLQLECYVNVKINGYFKEIQYTCAFETLFLIIKAD